MFNEDDPLTRKSSGSISLPSPNSIVSPLGIDYEKYMQALDDLAQYNSPLAFNKIGIWVWKHLDFFSGNTGDFIEEEKQNDTGSKEIEKIKAKNYKQKEDESPSSRSPCKAKKAWDCPHTNIGHYAKGKCKTCYLFDYHQVYIII